MANQELYPSTFTDEDKINYDILFRQSIQLYPQFDNDHWLVSLAVIQHIQKERGRYMDISPDAIKKIQEMYQNLPNLYITPNELEENSIIIE
jgi:hypothetical protein